MDAPFPVFSVEMFGETIGQFVDDNFRSKFVHGCIMVVELAPKEYEFYIAAALITGGPLKFKIVRISQKTNKEAYVNLCPLVDSFLKRLSVEKVGIETVKERARHGKKKNIIRKIIHVSGAAKYENSPEYLGSRQVEWSHQWMVRGHWRVVKGLGKDRAGEYTVTNYTWVISHTKGDGPEVFDKTRFVKKRS